MKIGICVKRVPDTETLIRIGADGKHIEQQGVQYVVNPYDEYGVEQGLQIKEALGEGEVVVLSLGPAGTDKIIRKCLAMGADRGIWIKDEFIDRDRISTARHLAEVVREENFDILFFGRQAVDDDSCQVGPMTAQLLGMPCVTDICEFELDGEKASVHKEIEGGEEIFELALPACFTCHKGLNEPRLPALKGIMMAKKKPLTTRDAKEEAPLVKALRMELPPTRPPGRIVGEGIEAVGALIGALQKEAKII